MYSPVARRLASATIALALVACGARTGLEGSDDWTGPAFGPHPLCESASGVRLCGGDPLCPEIPAPICKGYGCQHALDAVSGAQTAGGACLSDIPDNGNFRCNACNDGEACLRRASGELTCVPQDVCHALWDIGVRDVCLYADKSTYDDRPIPLSGPACPLPPMNPAASALCGGGCGGCPTATTRCTGRSPTRPIGLCQAPWFSSEIRSCVLRPNGSVERWCDDQFPYNYACVVYRNGSANEAMGLRYGSCVASGICPALRGTLGADCYNALGSVMP